MRSLVFVLLFAVGCTEHGEGGPLDGPGFTDDSARCFSGNTCKADEVCQQEGHAACNVPPASGICNCTNGVFECESSCPAGCPELAVPVDGESCAGVAEDTFCPYEDPAFSGQRVLCHCAGGVFDCSP